MPELPEVETIRRQLAERLPGRSLARVQVADPLLVAPEAPAAFAATLAGRRVGPVGRRGKYLLLGLDGGDMLALHLRMTGQLWWTPGAPDPALSHVRARFDLDDGSALVFADTRRFGRAWVLPARMAGRRRYWAARAGVEPLSTGFTARRLGALLAGRRAAIKPLLLDQRLVAGIGNIYADEALFQARIHPLRAAGDLEPRGVGRLHRAVRDRLRAGIASGGASIDRYRDTLGRPGAMQDLLRVHRHAGEPCPRCGTAILKTRVGGRGTYHCPRCQPAARC
jgi:formamidopyrimidine-DNA glycosylase